MARSAIFALSRVPHSVVWPDEGRANYELLESASKEVEFLGLRNSCVKAGEKAMPGASGGVVGGGGGGAESEGSLELAARLLDACYRSDRIYMDLADKLRSRMLAGRPAFFHRLA